MDIALMTMVDKIKKIKLFDDILTKGSFSQFKRYLIVGVTSFICEYLLFLLVFKVIGISLFIANSIVYSFVFIFNFLLNRIWSFGSKNDIRVQLLKYALLFFFNLVFSNVILYLLTNIAGIAPLISKILVMCAIVPWNFMMYKKVIYK